MTVAQSPTAREIVRRGEQLLIAQRYSEGESLLEAAAEGFPKDPDIRLLLGTFLVDTRPEEAVDHLAEAIRLDVDHPVRLTRAAGLLFALGYVDAAASYIGRALDLTPDGFVMESDAIGLSGRVAAVKGEDELAEEALREAVRLEPSNEFFVVYLARFLADRGRLSDAIASIDESVPLVRDAQRILKLRQELSP